MLVHALDLAVMDKNASVGCTTFTRRSRTELRNSKVSMLKHAIILVSILLLGCAQIHEAQLALGAATMTLAPSPRPSGCNAAACVELDEFERGGYAEARRGVRTWVSLVSDYYALRDRLIPNAPEDQGHREYRALQAVLAEQLDRRQITEAEWVYRLETKVGEIQARRREQSPKQVECTSERALGSIAGRYETKCTERR